MRYIKFVILMSACCLLAGIVQAQSLDWASLEEAQKQASETNKKVMLFAEATWCGYCKKMHKQVFPKKAVQDSLQKYFYPVKIDIESDKEAVFNGKATTHKKIGQQFRISATPTFVFLDSKGEVLGTQPGFIPAKVFDKLLAYVGSEQYSAISFEKYLNNHDIELKK